MSNGKLCDQDFEELRSACLESGELFTDPEFPPDDQSLFFSKDPPFAFEWKRASELSDDPKLFEGGASRFDINQVFIKVAKKLRQYESLNQIFGFNSKRNDNLFLSRVS